MNKREMAVRRLKALRRLAEEAKDSKELAECVRAAVQEVQWSMERPERHE
jgi:type II secretory pathway predicted ATPase ExeA